MSSPKDVPTDIESLRAFLVDNPEHRPGIPTGPGLGLGGRPGGLASTSAMLAIRELGISASAIQCSVFRELAPDFVDAKNTFVDYKGIGRVPVGHTGMTIESQFVEGIEDRVRHGLTVPFVADADHLPLTGNSPEQIAEFRRFVEAARDRTFFTIDPHFCMDLAASAPADKFHQVIPAFEMAAAILAQVKGGDPYVLELSIDEAPGITSVDELRLLVDRFAHLDMPFFSVAPAIGFTKKDDDTAAIRATLEQVLPALNRVAHDAGLVLGIHSGDGKSFETRQIIGELTEGNVWYKVSPDRQRLFFELMSDAPDGTEERALFEQMFDHLLNMIRRGATSEDAEFAANCRLGLQELDDADSSRPTAHSRIFYDFGFLMVTDFKDRLDALGEDFRSRYYDADLGYIRDLAHSVGLDGKQGNGHA